MKFRTVMAANSVQQVIENFYSSPTTMLVTCTPLPPSCLKLGRRLRLSWDIVRQHRRHTHNCIELAVHNSHAHSSSDEWSYWHTVIHLPLSIHLREESLDQMCKLQGIEVKGYITEHEAARGHAKLNIQLLMWLLEPFTTVNRFRWFCGITFWQSDSSVLYKGGGSSLIFILFTS